MDARHTDPVGTYLAAIASAGIDGCDVLGPGITLDATVPNWRFSVSGADAVRAELSRWYRSPGTFEELQRTPLPGGEVVSFTLRWTEDGVPHAAHQAHVVELGAGRITQLQIWCGGRWPASLLAEMAEAADQGG